MLDILILNILPTRILISHWRRRVIMESEQQIFIGSSENMKALNVPKNARLIITSPPYWNLKDYGHPDEIGKESYDDYLERMVTVFDQCYEHSHENAILAINLAHRRKNKVYRPIMWDLYAAMQKNGSKWKLIDNIIWYKPNELPQPNFYIERLLDNKFEYVLVFAKNYNYDYIFNKIRVPQKWLGKDPRKEKQNPNGRCISNIIRIPAYRPPNLKKMNYHQAAFPEELVQFFVDLYTNEGDTIMDPFVGSGTTLKVAKSMNRAGIGIEINPNNSKLIDERISENYEPVPYTKIDLIHSSTGTVEEHSKLNKGKRRRLVRIEEKKLFIDEILD